MPALALLCERRTAVVASSDPADLTDLDHVGCVVRVLDHGHRVSSTGERRRRRPQLDDDERVLPRPAPTEMSNTVANPKVAPRVERGHVVIHSISLPDPVHADRQLWRTSTPAVSVTRRVVSGLAVRVHQGARVTFGSWAHGLALGPRRGTRQGNADGRART